MKLPLEIEKLILSFVDTCNNCKIIIIDEEYCEYYNNEYIICMKCQNCFNLCDNCKKLYQDTLFCRFCGSICKYLCAICLDNMKLN